MISKDTKILVTGSSGFLGYHLSEELLRQGYYNSGGVNSHLYSLLNDFDIDRLLYTFRPEVIIHAAGRVGGIMLNDRMPATLFYENLKMGTQLMHKAFGAGVKKFVTIGTTCSYPSDNEIPFREETLWDGYPEKTNAAYGIAKRCLLTMGQAYRKQYDFNVIHLILANMYGPGDHFNIDSSHVIPALITKLVDAKELNKPVVTCFGTGSPTRDFLYVKDAAIGIVKAVAHYNEPEPLNFGSGNSIDIYSLVNKIAEIVEYRGNIYWDHSKPDGQMRRALNTTRAKKLLNWEAQMPLDQGLRETVEWYLKKLH